MSMWVLKYMNIPFKEKGRDFDGCDCWGLIRLIYKNELGIELPNYLECYNTTNDREQLSKVISEESNIHWIHPAFGYEKEFDVVILNMRGVPMHIGIVTKSGFMLHCAKGINTAHEKYKNTIRWQDKVKGFARYDTKRNNRK